MSLLSFIPKIKAQIYEIRCISQHLEEGELQISDLIKKSPNPVMNPNPKIESYLVTMSWFTENKRAPPGAHGTGPAQNRASGGGRRPVPSRCVAGRRPC